MTFSRSILVSEWATEHQPIVSTVENQIDWPFGRTKEEYLELPRKFFCKCGHVSEGEIESLVYFSQKERGWGYANGWELYESNKIKTKFEQSELPENFNPETDPYILRGNIICPECRQSPDLIFQWKMSGRHVEYDFVRVFDNRTREENNNNICLSMGFTEYYFNRDVQKIGCQSKTVRLTHNIHTGMTYAIKATGRRAIANCSYGMFPGFMERSIGYACTQEQETVTEFMRLLIDARLEWTTMEKVQAYIHSLNSTHAQLVYVMTLCALPQLQCLPFTRYAFTKTRDRKKIREAGFNGKELYTLIAGNASKQVRKFITDENKLYSYLKYSRIFKDNNNLMKLLVSEDGGNYRFGGNHSVYGLAKDFEQEQDGSRRDGKRERQVYQFMMNIHRDEAHFTQSLLKVKQQRVTGYQPQAPQQPQPDPEDGMWRVQPPATPIYKYEFNLNHAWYMCKDVVRMLEDILIRDIDYKWEYKGDIQEFHDKLSRDLDRYHNPYKVIPYSDEEVEVYNRTVKGYTFRLAESNHELVAIGSDQNICVGGYGNRAVQKQCDIVLVSNEIGEHRITIELNQGGYYLQAGNFVCISQVKLKRNARPDTIEASIVAEWCYETNTRWDNCHDLQAAKGCEWPEIPTGESPIWIEGKPQEEEHRQELLARQEAQKIMGIEPDPIPRWQQPRFVNGQNNQGPQPAQQPIFAGDFDDFPF